MDFNKIMTEALEERRKGNMFRAYQPEEQPPQEDELNPNVVRATKRATPLEGSSAANPKHISIDGETDLNATYGPQQVQSLLGLVVDSPLHKQLEDANDDVLATQHLNNLNSHRRG